MEIKRFRSPTNKNTFRIPIIYEIVSGLVMESEVSIDPFCGESNLCTYRNDIKLTGVDSLDWMRELISNKIRADLVIFDPPYTQTQMDRKYGRNLNKINASELHSKARNLINQLVNPGGIVCSFGFNSLGMGARMPYEIEKIYLINHGSGHNDTIITISRKLKNGLVL